MPPNTDDVAKAEPGSAMAVAPRKSLVSKLAEVMGEVHRIPKSGRNDFHKYDYATEADIVEAVRGGMAQRGLVLVPSVEKMEWADLAGGKQRLCTLTVRFTVIDGETDSRLDFVAIGQGSDAGDKATYKAMTGAVKYALLKLFLIPTGDDPEAEKTPPAQGQRAAPKEASAKKATPPPATPKPSAAEVEAEKLRNLRRKRIWNRAQALGFDLDHFKKWVLAELGADMPSQDWTDAQIQRLEGSLADAERVKGAG